MFLEGVQYQVEITCQHLNKFFCQVLVPFCILLDVLQQFDTKPTHITVLSEHSFGDNVRKTELKRRWCNVLSVV